MALMPRHPGSSNRMRPLKNQNEPHQRMIRRRVKKEGGIKPEAMMFSSEKARILFQ
jgi:hypothetical protein